MSSSASIVVLLLGVFGHPGSVNIQPGDWSSPVAIHTAPLADGAIDRHAVAAERPLVPPLFFVGAFGDHPRILLAEDSDSARCVGHRYVPFRRLESASSFSASSVVMSVTFLIRPRVLP